MSRQSTSNMNLTELEALLAKSSPPLKQLLVKAINIYADPMQNAEDNDQKRDALQAAIETAANKT